MPKKIILFNMGGSSTQEELKEFIFNLLNDKRVINSPFRYVIASIVAHFRHKKKWQEFKEIGGSKIYEHSYNLAKKIEELTNHEVKIAMRYTSPSLKDAIGNSKDVCIIPLYPHDSGATTGSFADHLKKLNFNFDIGIVKPFSHNEAYNRIIANKILNTIENPSDWHLILSAHGLPISVIEKGDPYQKHIEAQLDILKTMLPDFNTISLAYQSRFGNKKWLQPYLADKLQSYKGKKVLIYPISFIIDNLETDHELNIEYREIAENIGLEAYKIVPCLNDDNEIAKFLITQIQQIPVHK